MAVDVPDKQIAFLSAECEALCAAILKDLGVRAVIDKSVVGQLTAFFLRDIYRIDQQQRGSVSLAKHAGYWGFWIRKLKPISKATHIGEPHITKEELVRINEVVSVYFSIELVLQARRAGQDNDMVRVECLKLGRGRCDGVQCFNRYIQSYLNFGGGFFLRYITYSMAFRTFGPHHFALLIEGLVYSSCPTVNGTLHA